LTTVRPLECGWLECDLGALLAGRNGATRIPVPAFLIEHPRGLVLFDSGLHPELAHSSDRLRSVASIFTPSVSEDETVAARLSQLGYDPADIAIIASSHLHFDHCGGHSLVPNARVAIQRAEWDAAHDPGMIELGGYNPNDFEVGHDVELLDGDHDLFGDGSLRLVVTDGHTAGHQSLVVDDRTVLLGDACYCQMALDSDELPPFCHDQERQRATFEWIRARQATGQSIIYSHDPAQWATLPAEL
jgi:glyoxylase-like metal-dependent hydrolase (beta-lactamase superfamily II)